VTVDDCKTILDRQDDGSRAAEIPAISACHALMPTREAALAEPSRVFATIAGEYRERSMDLPADTTEILHAWRHGARVSASRRPSGFEFARSTGGDER
jgi:hypothetical protein